jgi:hypothetical protein
MLRQRLFSGCVVLVVLALVAGACGDDDTGSEGADFDQAVALVLDLDQPSLFALLDTLDDSAHSALLDEVDAADDLEFATSLDYAAAVALVESLDDGIYDDLVAAASGYTPGTTVALPSTTNATTPATTLPAGSVPPVGDDDLRVVDGGNLSRRGTVSIPIVSGDMSFLAYARTGTADAQVFVTAVEDPSGRDVGDAIGLEYGELSNFGDAAVYVPIRREVALIPGDYRVSFESAADIVSSGAIVRSGDPDALQALDVVFWMATTVEYDRAALEARFRAVGNQLLNPHGVTVGSMAFVDPPQEVVNRYRVLQFTEEGSDDDLRSLCRQMSAETGVGAGRAINFAIVDRLDDGDPDSVIEGSSSGLPGTAMLGESDLSCVAGMGAVDSDFDGRDLFDRAIVIWHEAGHHLGLYHTSEGDGLYFDLLDDTPECPIDRDENNDGYIDIYECDGLDAENFMFYDGDGVEMSNDQAWSLRRHPLLYPTG